MAWATLLIAGIGLAISVTLASVRIWETFLSRSKFDLACDWLDASETDLELQFTIANVGYRPDSIRAIEAVSEDGQSYRSAQITQRLPVRLRPGEVSPRFVMVVRTDVAHDPSTSLFVGKGRLVITDSLGRTHQLAVPGAYDGPGIYALEPEPPPPDE
jgi:hypothetical protein